MAVLEEVFRHSIDDPNGKYQAVEALHEWAADHGYDDTCTKVLNAYADDWFPDNDDDGDNALDAMMSSLMHERLPRPQWLIRVVDVDNRQFVYQRLSHLPTPKFKD